MKKVGLCDNCGRSMYTNEVNLCKRCNQEVGSEKEEVLEQKQTLE